MHNLKLKLLNLHYFTHFKNSIQTHINHHLNSFLSHNFLDLQSLLQSHAFIITTGNHNNIFIASKLISFYTSLSLPNSCTKVFNSLQFKDPFLWNSIIKSHFSNGYYERSLLFYELMRNSNAKLSDFTVPMVVSSCAEIGDVVCGKVVHGLVQKLGFYNGYAAIGASFVYFYAKCGYMGDACNVFDEMSERDVVAWTALVIGYVQNDENCKAFECFCAMHRLGKNGERPNSRTFEGGFQACGNLGLLIQGRILHSLAIKSGHGCFVNVKSSILLMYSKCGTIEEVFCAFCEVGEKDLISWTLMIGAYARLGHVNECLNLCWQMQEAGVRLDGVILSCVLSCFGDSSWVREGKAFHGLIMRRFSVLDQMVYRALMSMYCKFGIIEYAEMIFDRHHEMSSESWNMMVCEYAKTGVGFKCLELFREMQHKGIECDSNGFVSAISSCSILGSIRLGMSLHCYLMKSHGDENISISNTLIDMYGKCGNLALAQRIFHRVQKDTVTWNSMISAYVHREHAEEAIALFDKMVREGPNPNPTTMLAVISACSQLASLDDAERIHNYIKHVGIELKLSLATALIDMYGKCGQLEKARQIFSSMKEKDVIAWNVMISCYGKHGDGQSATEIFRQMERSNVKPNGLTFLAVLSSCSHSGLVESGKCLFAKMQQYSVDPTIKHYACIIDLLGKVGKLEEAEATVLSMPMKPDGGIWGALLSACQIHGEIERGIRVAKRAIECDNENDGYYVMLSNMLDCIGKWEEAERVRRVMKEMGVRKRVGWSSL